MITIDPNAPDPFRVINGNTPISNDLDPNVFFSAKYRGGVVPDFFAFSPVPQTGSQPWSRYYDNYPNVFPVGTAADGTIVYPRSTVWAYAYSGQGMTLWNAERTYLQVTVYRDRFDWSWERVNLSKLIVYAFG